MVQVAYAGICNSDIQRSFGGGAYHYPLIMGHEFSGAVKESFAGSRFSAGDRVVVYPLLPCHTCEACQTGDYAQCLDYDYFGSRRPGGFAASSMCRRTTSCRFLPMSICSTQL